HRDAHAVRRRDLPERRALTAAVRLGMRRPEETPQEARRPHPARADVGQVGGGVALHEVEDAVARGTGTRGEGGPGDGRLGRVRGRERPELAALGEGSEAWQVPLLHPAREQVRIDAVEAEDHETPPRMPTRLPLPAAAARDQGDREQRTHHGAQTAYSSGNSRSTSTGSAVTRIPL